MVASRTLLGVAFWTWSLDRLVICFLKKTFRKTGEFVRMYPGSNLGPAWLAARLNGRGSLEIYTGVSRLIDSGELPAGARLPTVRELSPLSLIHI